jgi:hypothetical protein
LQREKQVCSTNQQHYLVSSLDVTSLETRPDYQPSAQIIWDLDVAWTTRQMLPFVNYNDCIDNTTNVVVSPFKIKMK